MNMDTMPCSGCHSPLALDATGCQICMRSRTKQEIMRGYALVRERKELARRRPYKIAAGILLAAASAALLRAYGGRVLAVASPAVRSAIRRADDMRNPENYASRPVAAPAPAAPPPEPGAPVAPEDALRSQLLPRDPPPAPPAGSPAAAPAAAPARPSAPRPLVKNAWRVSGTVYDLATLEPLQGADVMFLVDEREREKVTTDAEGRYEVDLAKGDGWTVSVEAHDRRPGQVVDVDPPYRLRDADERRAAFEHIADGDLIPAPIGWKRTTSRARLDLVVIPTRWTEPAGR